MGPFARPERRQSIGGGAPRGAPGRRADSPRRKRARSRISR